MLKAKIISFVKNSLQKIENQRVVLNVTTFLHISADDGSTNRIFYFHDEIVIFGDEFFFAISQICCSVVRNNKTKARYLD